MSETEIALAQAYLSASDQDPVGALIRSVKDLARTRRLLASLPRPGQEDGPLRLAGPRDGRRDDRVLDGIARA